MASALDYLLVRTANEAERLELQHQLYMSCQGYYIHPDINLPAEGARVAELGTGTAIWLRELAPAHATTEFHGFDISDGMYPNKDILPPNLQLHIADLKKPFDAHWLGQFDLVHVRLVMAAMKKDEWAVTVRNVTTLLKPGGWLQWTEDDRPVAVRNTLRPVAPADAAKNSLSPGANPAWRPARVGDFSMFNSTVMPDDRAEAMLQGYLSLRAFMSDPEYGGLEHVHRDAFFLDRQDDGGQVRRKFAEMGLAASWNMVQAREDVGDKLTDMSRDEWVRKALRDIDAGGCHVTRALCCIGRKRL